MKSSASTAVSSNAGFLQRFRTFTEKGRKPAYIQALRLPLNYAHFTELNRRTVQFLPDHTCDKETTEIVSALCSYYPDLKVQWLPGIVYPFVKLFPKDSLAQFQIALTFLGNWCAPWFTDYPSPAKEVVELVGSHLPELEKAVNDLGSAIGGLIWPMFLVCFTDVLNKKDWLELFDLVLTRPLEPWILLAVVIELLRHLQPELLQLKSLERMHCLLRKERNLDVKAIIRCGLDLAESHQEAFRKLYREARFPLPKDRYPVIKFMSDRAQHRLQMHEHQQVASKKLEEEVDRLEHELRRKNVELQVLTGSHVANYSQKLELALRNHLKHIEQTNHRKLEALRETEQELRQWIASNEDYRRQESGSTEVYAGTVSDYVKRRAVLERAIDQTKKQTEAVRQMEVDAMHRLKQIVRHKQEEELRLADQLHNNLHSR